MPSLQGEPIALAIRTHQTKPATGWAYRDLVEELHVWVDRFDQDFNLGLPTPVIVIDELPVNVLGQYCLGHSEIGTRTTITLNVRWLPCRPFCDTLVTLVHELLHAYEEWHLGKERAAAYHTKAWRDKMQEVGIVADEHGHTLRVLPVFVEYLKRYHVPTFSFPQAVARAPSKRRQMQKWVCGCQGDDAKPARAVRLRAVCQDCHQLYRRADS